MLTIETLTVDRDGFYSKSTGEVLTDPLKATTTITVTIFRGFYPGSPGIRHKIPIPVWTQRTKLETTCELSGFLL